MRDRADEVRRAPPVVGRPRPLSVAILAVALAASLATSPGDRPGVRADLEEQAFTISPDDPELRVGFHTEATDATFLNDASGATSFTYGVAFGELADGVIADPDLLEVVLEGPGAASGATPDGGDWSCDLASCPPGAYVVTFRWPSHLDTGWARVHWSAGYRVGWAGDQEPEGAKANLEPVELEALPPAGATLRRGWLASEVSVTRLEVRSTQALPEGALHVEIGPVSDRPPEARPEVFLLGEDGAAPLATSTSTPIPLPPACAAGACVATVRLVAQAAAGSPATSVEYALVSAADAEHVTVGAQEIEPASSTAATALPPVSVVPDELVPLRLRLTVPEAAVSPDDEAARPVLRLTASAEVRGGDDARPSGARPAFRAGVVAVTDADDGGTADATGAPSPSPAPQNRIVHPPELHPLEWAGRQFELPCPADGPCTVDVHLEMRMLWSGGPPELVLEPQVVAELLYPTARTAPDAALTLQPVSLP